MGKRVIILGGGIAGLSAAHELIERGFSVEIFERRSIAGGKARSIEAVNPVRFGATPSGHAPRRPGRAARRGLPGEHGFRFFPGFYKHVIDTMRRIPYGANGNTFDNLTVATRILLARSNQAEITWLARCPASLNDFRVFLQELFAPLGVPADETSYFIER